MSKLHTLGGWLRRFLTEHIVTERNLARNTQLGYRDCFFLLLPFVADRVRKPVDRLALDDLTGQRVLQFLDHLEEERKCTVQTRNQRLAAIRAFARYVASRDPAQVEWSGHIRAIPLKKAIRKPIDWLDLDEMDVLLEVPDRSTPRGRMEYALLLFLYNTGARVSEATGLKVKDLQIQRRDGKHPLVSIHGKGGKHRQCPLWPRTGKVLAELLRGRSPDDAVFLSRQNRPYTRSGAYRLVERCARQVPSLSGRKITPHSIRHTAACHLLQAKVDLNTIRAWLGHESLDTTNLYAEIDFDSKARAMALCDASKPGPDRPWKEDKGLMAFLESL
ncbi:MAG: tyrosine-type recombinase/integrase [Gammaproteobacteria bacterium]|nr:tyrosine-type recombinase/integrase [Gammaproteobacteria bacterium]